MSDGVKAINEKIYYINNIKIDISGAGSINNVCKGYELLLSPSALEYSIINFLEQIVISKVGGIIQNYVVSKDKKELVSNNKNTNSNSNGRSSVDDSGGHNVGSVMLEFINSRHNHSGDNLYYNLSSSATNQSCWDKINIYIG